MIIRPRTTEIVAQAALLLAGAAALCGVRVTLIYSVIGAEGERFTTTSFDDAAETARRVATGERAA